MKTKILFTLILVGLAMSGCSKEDDEIKNDPDKVTPDPSGTVIISVTNESNGGNSFQGIGVSDSGNFYSTLGSSLNWTFSGLGEMKGLGNITDIPPSGYVGEFSVRTGYGYVGKGVAVKATSYEVNYIRFWVESMTGTGAEVRYQYPFKGTANSIQLVSESILLDQANGSGALIELKEQMSFKATLISFDGVLPNWLTLSKSEDGSCKIVVKANVSVTEREAKVLVESEGRESKQVTIKQKGAAPFISVNESQKNISVVRTSSNGSISISSNTKCTVASDVSWCTVSPQSGEGNYNIGFNISQNNSGEKRKATITISANEVQDVKITITQDLFFSGGTGAQGDPYIISNVDHLLLIQHYYYGSFRMAKDIDLTNYLKSTSNGWEPINYFTGSFDGNGHTISGLWIDRSQESRMGLFSSCEGNISNLTVKIASKGIIGGEGAGGLIGYLYNYGTITNCSVLGNITGSSYVGGIVGYCTGATQISKCKFDGDVLGVNAGGIAGFSSSTINFSQSAGLVQGTIIGGGIVGLGAACKLANSYSTSEVSVNGYNYACYVGGAVGKGDFQTSATRCYHAGAISVTFTAGGSGRKTGIAGEGIITASYYDSTVAGSGITDTNNGRTTAQMKQKATYIGWDFNQVWTMTEGTTYPTLR